MDLSKLPDAQRQELQRLQKQFDEHKKQSAGADVAALQEQQLPAYDPSQLHKYDQSLYYKYIYQDTSQQQQSQQQYDASYYQNYYSNSYQQQQQYRHPETETATASSDPQQNEGSGSGSLGLGQVQDPYIDPCNVGRTLPNSGYPVPPGLNAAAVAALSQLTQFTGTMDAAIAGGAQYDQGNFHPQGVGRRGAGPFRGGGHGISSFWRPNTGGSVPPFHGRGRGCGRGRVRGGGRHGPQSAAKEFTAPIRCELCRVDCTSKEILEQHNNGKRHKKNLQKLQDTKGTYKPIVQTEKDEKPGSGAGPEVQENSPQIKSDQKTEVGDYDSNNKVETPENDKRTTKPWMKRKMRGGVSGRCGAKRLKLKCLVKPKVAIPFVCDLCNVKCDTQEVFDRHAAGKKHMAKLKRFEGHQAMYGPTAVQALYPPNPLSQTLAPQPAYYGAPTSYSAPPESYIPHQNPNPQLADAPLEFGPRNVVSGPQTSQVSTGETHVSNGVK